MFDEKTRVTNPVGSKLMVGVYEKIRDCDDKKIGDCDE